MFRGPLTIQRCLFRIALVAGLLIYDYQNPVPLWYSALLAMFGLYHVVRLVVLMKQRNKVL